jgi:hypothetical protein
MFIVGYCHDNVSRFISSLTRVVKRPFRRARAEFILCAHEVERDCRRRQEGGGGGGGGSSELHTDRVQHTGANKTHADETRELGCHL